jgi:hypothetical protein
MFRGIARGLFGKNDCQAVRTSAEESVIDASVVLVEAKKSFDKEIERAGERAQIAEMSDTLLAAAKAKASSKDALKVLA